MPVILRINGYRFFFYSNEGDPLEPAHVHVSKAGSEAKIWLEPEAVLSRNDGFGARELREVRGRFRIRNLKYGKRLARWSRSQTIVFERLQ